MSRIGNSTLAFYERNTTQMGAIRREAETLQSQLSSGTRLSRSSQDPVASSRLRQLERADQLAAIDADNAARANDELSLAGSAIQMIVQDVARARELALWAASSSLSNQERASIGEELSQLRLGILANANGRDSGGNALFGGSAPGAAYATDAAGNAAYVGTAQSGELALGDGQFVTRGVTGPEFLRFEVAGAPTDLLAYLKQVSDALVDPATDTQTAIAAARTAVGDLEISLDSLVRTQTIVGARLAWVESVQNRQEVKGEARASEAGDIGGIDLGSTIAELQQMMTVLEASQAGFARLSSLSLFNAI